MVRNHTYLLICCGSRLLEGRSVCLCWENSKPKGPEGSKVNLPGRTQLQGLMRRSFGHVNPRILGERTLGGPPRGLSTLHQDGFDRLTGKSGGGGNKEGEDECRQMIGPARRRAGTALERLRDISKAQGQNMASGSGTHLWIVPVWWLASM